MPVVGVAVPSQRTWESRSGVAITSMCARAVSAGIQIALLSRESSMITKARNDLAEIALQNNCDYVIFVDTDMLFPADTILRLLSHQKEIVGCLYRKRVPPYELLGALAVLPGHSHDEIMRRGGLQLAECLAGGLFMVRTDVFRRVPKPWFFETYYRDMEARDAWRDMLGSYFHTVPPKETVEGILRNKKFRAWIEAEHAVQKQLATETVSEDLNFCRKASRHGVLIWADIDLSYEVRHLGAQEVGTLPPEPLREAAE